MKPHLAGLDHLRALAIALVFFFHYRHFAHPLWIDDVDNFGWSGVDLFFVLSGYLISTPLLLALRDHAPLPLPQHVIKRATRILPPYFIIVALYFAFPDFRERSAPAPLWRFLTFTQNFGLDLRSEGTFSHAWSLCVEEHFYFALPLVLWVARRKPRLLLALLPLLIVAGCYTRWLAFGRADDTFAWYRLVYYPTYQRLDSLLAGVGLAALVVFVPTASAWMRAHRYWLLGVALLVIAAAWRVTGDPRTLAASVAGFPIVACGYGALTAAAIALQLRPWRLTATLAKLSYAIYLLHKGVIHLVQRAVTALGGGAASITTLGACIVAVVFAAWLMRLVVERPALILRDRWLNALTPADTSQRL